MSRPSVSLLGPAEIRVSDRVVRPTPLTTAVLTRLVLADREPLTVDEIFTAVWGDRRALTRADRISVQKRILELRKILADPSALVTEAGQVSAYRLTIPRADVDVHAFRDLVERARRETPVNAVTLLEQALGLWRGRPLFDTERYPFAQPAIRALRELQDTATLDLVTAYADIGQPEKALSTGAALLDRRPDLPGAADAVARLRRRVAERRPGVEHRDFPGLGTRVTIRADDLFAQRDAQLVIGFCDTFDTSTDRNVVISRATVQGQFLHWAYDGDTGRLNRDLRSALRGARPERVERREDKRRGKRARYPLGTVAVLHRDDRRFFCVAYSVMGNDLVARSDLESFRASLDRLWDAAVRYGQREPLAVPLLGSGLARLDGTDRTELVTLLIESFLRHSRRQVVSRELRLVLRVEDLDRVDLLEVAAFLRAQNDRE
ncbi:macro domain-containing protein [Cryptosporangium arvum]|uniref:Putative transcriptional regulator n=1 Tax=Cryptosporangium arvum DSM 44712 TaxID=927661 RepID=A0A011AGQ0_9ACTN|nr:macro domain-containing protein [Cryptosporangium arvum]EXG81176.1 putative transcriptional regulator [Cryptosporangium arvum DSM 44712]